MDPHEVTEDGGFASRLERLIGAVSARPIARERRHDMSDTQGLAHIALTVTDTAASAEWYRRLFDAQSVFADSSDGHDMDVLLAGNLLIGLHTHAGTAADDRFAEARVGLDHVAIACADDTALDAWRDRLDQLGIAHSGIQASPFGAHLNFRDPDNIPLELFVAAVPDGRG